MNEWWKTLEARAMHSAEPLNPQRVFWELSPRLPDNCDHHGGFRLRRQLVSRAISRCGAA